MQKSILETAEKITTYPAFENGRVFGFEIIKSKCKYLIIRICIINKIFFLSAAIAQLGERQTEDLKVTGSIPVRGDAPH